ncbi:hypothetical protein SKAU_G00158770 [Synaphobranchus kaupii]|uniref:Multiple epidermal growth factor-like domains protein 6 n=1 Tax=Synaphobranchus kaupii TaxID=118154 RepID=A0A9Q1FIJ0_SYNKA|nr:hypothetical protein SKAU_G00158770 [Synaphobranchus kaupii]
MLALSHQGRNLQPYMPNVCVEHEVLLVAQRQPCVQAFTRMVKVWKQGCAGQSRCLGYERRTAYYTAYRQVYRQDYQTVYKCCPGWSQLNGEAGCLYPVCSYGVCFNGGQCGQSSSQLCDCPRGFNGPSCQYGSTRRECGHTQTRPQRVTHPLHTDPQHRTPAVIRDH